MHTLQSEPVVYQELPECHERITNTYEETMALINANAHSELAAETSNYITAHATHFIEELLQSNVNASMPSIQVIVERPTVTNDQEGALVMACMVGMYSAKRGTETHDSGEALGELFHSFALVLDSTTRRIVSCREVQRGEGEQGLKILH